ncbi:hypothetical protein GCM10025771_00360 [Niveibacterium umoris]|uniref:Uncharacterized protein n=1 Tax=Niveibacterium umoris TaxID=1193620 RepID=A0A840BQE4_9RHOO|nr:hypothetical protein [Niveibacterium umoris]MBB4014904.1 hypothetical protein [Niveibacterium umoris]
MPGAIQLGVGDRLIQLCNGNASLVIDAAQGGRIVSLRCEGGEVLAQPADHPENFGSTFWDAPQSMWGWPPRAVLDSGPYLSEILPCGVLLTSARDPVSGLRFSKRIERGVNGDGFIIEYGIRNEGALAVQVGPWEVTRVPGGLSFYAAGPDAKVPVSALDTVRDEAGVVWYEFDRSALETGRKHFGAAAQGWLAHVTPSRRLFVKSFDRLDLAACAPTHAPIEIWGQDGGAYVELENHGPYQTLQTGESLRYPVMWRACALPEGLAVESGCGALVALARSMAAC